MSEQDFYVRAFDPDKDLESAYKCYVSGFYQCLWPLIDHAEKRFTHDIIRMSHKISDVSLVAEADGEARGFLMGFFPREPKSLIRATFHSLGFFLKVLFRKYQMTPFARAAYWQGIRGDLSNVLHGADSIAEVLVLTSQKNYRHGIGTALMNAWVAEVRKRGYRKTSVCTDSTVNWRFYEKYGFRKVSEYPLKSFYYALPGVDVTGYRYVLDLE